MAGVIASQQVRIVWREDIESSRRWMSMCCQLLRMQRDIAHAQRHTPGTGYNK